MILGRGGLAEVELADHPRRGAVARKRARHEEDAWALREEFLLLAQLSHPALPRVFELEGSAYTMERIEGAPLEGVPGPEAALALADVLAYLHERGVAHGDLRPANVIVRREGHPIALLDPDPAAGKDVADDEIALAKLIGLRAPKPARELRLSLSAALGPRPWLAPAPPSFVGRAALLARAYEAASRGRPLAIEGPPGSGKTRFEAVLDQALTADGKPPCDNARGGEVITMTPLDAEATAALLRSMLGRDEPALADRLAGAGAGAGAYPGAVVSFVRRHPTRLEADGWHLVPRSR